MNEEIIGHKATLSSVTIPTRHQSESSNIGSYSSGRVESAADLWAAAKKIESSHRSSLCLHNVLTLYEQRPSVII
jgi:hypothetical protein